jgi:hypothetical protein
LLAREAARSAVSSRVTNVPGGIRGLATIVIARCGSPVLRASAGIELVAALGADRIPRGTAPSVRTKWRLQG